MASNRFSLHIGVNNVDTKVYNGARYSPLCGCANDARAMANLAVANCFTVMDVLIDERARFDTVASCLEYAVEELKAGDAFLLTFSGHGISMVYSEFLATVSNPADDSDREDKHDEGLVLYDLVMKDNYLHTYLRRFRSGVQVILVMDCCHSRTIHSFGANSREHRAPDDSHAGRCRKNRRMKIDKSSGPTPIQRARYKTLDQRYKNIGRKNKQNIQADMVLLSACDDNQMAADGPDHGLFTKTMLEILRSGANGDGMPFIGSYEQLVDAMKPKTGNAQVPGATLLGPNCENKSCRFFQGPPFV